MQQILYQVDPIGMASASIGNPQSMNLFAYVRNNPIDFVDPSGLNLSSTNFACYDIVTTGHFTNDPDTTYVNTRTICHFFGGGSGGSIGGIGGGGDDIPRGGRGSGGGGSSGDGENGDSSSSVDTKCWTYQDILDHIKVDYNNAWNKTNKSGKENGGFVLITDNLKLLTYEREEGSKKSMGRTLPLIRELKKKYKYGVIAGYHTHPPGSKAVPSGVPGRASTGDYGVLNNADGPNIGIVKVGDKITVYDANGIIKPRDYDKTFACVDSLNEG